MSVPLKSALLAARDLLNELMKDALYRPDGKVDKYLIGRFKTVIAEIDKAMEKR